MWLLHSCVLLSGCPGLGFHSASLTPNGSSLSSVLLCDSSLEIEVNLKRKRQKLEVGAESLSPHLQVLRQKIGSILIAVTQSSTAMSCRLDYYSSPKQCKLTNDA